MCHFLNFQVSTFDVRKFRGRCLGLCFHLNFFLLITTVGCFEIRRHQVLLTIQQFYQPVILFSYTLKPAKTLLLYIFTLSLHCSDSKRNERSIGHITIFINIFFLDTLFGILNFVQKLHAATLLIENCMIQMVL